VSVLSPERVGKLTGSRVPKVLGLSSHGGPEDVLREMVREARGYSNEFTGNRATEWGERHESVAIAEYEMTTGQAVEHTGMEQIFVPHPHLSWAGVTLDGTVGELGLVEAYAPFRLRINHWSQHPAKEAQMRFQLECCPDRTWCDFLVWYPEGLMPVSRVEHDPDWFRQRGGGEASVLVRLTRFMDRYHKTVESDELSAPYLAPLVDVRTDPEWTEAEDWLNELVFERERNDAAIEKARATLVQLAGKARSVKGRYGTLYRRPPSPTVRYKAAIEKYAPEADLAPFTTKPKGGPIWAYRRFDSKEE